MRDGNGLIQGLGNGIRHRSERMRAPAAAGTAAGRSTPVRADDTDVPRGHHGEKMTGKTPRCHSSDVSLMTFQRHWAWVILFFPLI